MATPCFYYPELTEHDDFIELSSAESAHLSKSRRLKVGHVVNLINGKGLVASAKVVIAENRRVQVQCTNVVTHAPCAKGITIATAVPKGDRPKVMVDMLTQLGVSRIIPIRYEYSVTPFRGKLHDKWQRIAIEACKQSQNPWLPNIEPEWGFTDFLANSRHFSGSNDSPAKILYAHAKGQSLRSLVERKCELIVMIGPEGGFSDSELSALKTSGANSLALGDHILRTEVAAVAAMSQLATD